MRRLRNSWELVKVSWAVLRADKELLWIPVLSGLAWVGVAVLFVIPFLLTDVVSAAPDGRVSVGPLAYVLAFVAYVALAFVTVFFQAAMVHAAGERLAGGDPTVGGALRGAASRAGRLLPWAIVVATVSMVLRTIEERAGVVGRIVVGLVGLAWSLVTFLVLPVIVVEDQGPFASVKRSAELFRHTWGENVIANAGIGLVGVLAALPAVVVAGVAVATGVAAVAVVGVGVAVVWIATVAVVFSALTAVYQMALYRFAVDGRVPDAFASADLTGAFAPRR